MKRKNKTNSQKNFQKNIKKKIVKFKNGRIQINHKFLTSNVTGEETKTIYNLKSGNV